MSDIGKLIEAVGCVCAGDVEKFEDHTCLAGLAEIELRALANRAAHAGARSTELEKAIETVTKKSANLAEQLGWVRDSEKWWQERCVMHRERVKELEEENLVLKADWRKELWELLYMGILEMTPERKIQLKAQPIDDVALEDIVDWIENLYQTDAKVFGLGVVELIKSYLWKLLNRLDIYRCFKCEGCGSEYAVEEPSHALGPCPDCDGKGWRRGKEDTNG